MDRLLNNGNQSKPFVSPARENGFTLIEVLVALAILSIALTSIYRLQSQTMAMSAKAWFYSMAPRLAEAKLVEIEREGMENLSDGSGDFGSEFPGYLWSVSTQEVPMEFLQDRPYHFVRIDLTIGLNDEESYALRTYRFYPE
jgi:general secretion pathway protein I